MSRTEVAKTRDALVEAALVINDTDLDDLPTAERRAAWHAFMCAVDRYRAAVARQSVDDPEVYVQNNSRTADREAAQAAILSRGKWRRIVYRMLQLQVDLGATGRSDRWLEEAIRSRAIAFRQFEGDPLDPAKVTHQTISSARKSLVDCGLVRACGGEIVNGRLHTLWTVTRHV